MKMTVGCLYSNAPRRHRYTDPRVTHGDLAPHPFGKACKKPNTPKIDALFNPFLSNLSPAFCTVAMYRNYIVWCQNVSSIARQFLGTRFRPRSFGSQALKS